MRSSLNLTELEADKKFGQVDQNYTASIEKDLKEIAGVGDASVFLPSFVGSVDS
jgi:hypothetical protein